MNEIYFYTSINLSIQFSLSFFFQNFEKKNDNQQNQTNVNKDELEFDQQKMDEIVRNKNQYDDKFDHEEDQQT